MKVEVMTPEELERRKKYREREEECCNKCKAFIGISILILLCVYLICLITMIIIQKLEGNL
tara:strand:+ start:1504 stop:1686 length:183 start_codon:yes stop_codon:yes gene_type:complete